MLAGVALAAYLVLRQTFRPPQQFSREENEPTKINRLTRQRVGENADTDSPPELLRWQVEMHETARELKGELDSKLAALQALVLMARQESQRLEAAIKTGEAMENAPPRDRLARIEGLAEPEALASAESLAQVANEMPQLPSDVAADLFAADHRMLEITRLQEKGHPAAEISRRLGLPLGEIELLLSLRHY
jgi:DNA-binding NarL/FixJ family response regulator